MRKESGIQTLLQELEARARGKGVVYFGAADLRPVADFIAEHEGEWLLEFPYAITGAMPAVDAWVAALTQHSNPKVMQSYREFCQVIDDRWLDLEYEFSMFLQNNGYRALPISEHSADKNKNRGVISHKLPAHLAGFGWIGKNTLLVTPERGPRVRLFTVLTSAPLIPTKPNVQLNYDGCGDCHLCVDICPIKALKGIPFSPDIPRDVRLNATMCRDYRKKQEKLTGAPTCGLCLSICPVGQGKNKHIK